MNAAVISPPASAIELPTGIPGLDTKLGLAHMAGKKPLYVAMLRRFTDSQAGAGRQIRESLARGDRETAERVAHTLKSVSATVGAIDIQKRAAQLEHALREGETVDELQMLLVELELPLGGLVAALQDAL